METSKPELKYLIIPITPNARVLTYQNQTIYVSISPDGLSIDIASAYEDTNNTKWYTRIPINQGITIETIAMINDRLYILTSDKTRKPIFKVSLKHGFFKKSW